jgi:glc operon protein GlcG
VINLSIRQVAMALALGLAYPAAAAELATKKALTLELVKTIAASAEEFARKNNWNVAIAIHDDAGHLLHFQRMDGVQIGSIETAIRKSQSAARFRRSGKAFADRLAGEPQVMMLPGAFPFEGGLPIMHEGQLLGAIGVSGVTSQQDAMIAQAGLDGLARALKN